MIQAFGIARFTGPGVPAKAPAAAVKEINDRLDALKVPSEDVISIQVDDEFYHIFYRKSK